MKKVLVCALAALMLMTTCMSALANPLTASDYVTTTTYVIDAEGYTKLQVNTHADAAAGTMLTYLAHTGAEPTDLSIVYIDQQTADDNGADFSYTTAEANISGVTVKYGSSLNDNAVEEPDEYNLRNITVTYNGASETINLPTTYNANVTTIIDLDMKATGTIKAYTATIGEVSVKDLVNIDDAGNITVTDGALLADKDNATIALTVEFEPEIEVPVVPDTVESGRFSGYEAGNPVEKMTMFGSAANAGAATENWGGIIVGETAEDVTASTPDAPVGTAKVYRAIFKGPNGEFAVQLVDKTGSNELTSKSWFGKIYVGNEGGYGYSAVKEIAKSEQAGY